MDRGPGRTAGTFLAVVALAVAVPGRVAAAEDAAATEIEALRREVDSWRRRAHRMAAEWAAARAERDALRQTLQDRERYEARERPETVVRGTAGEVRIVDVNETLGWVILGIGGDAGLRPGMMYRVIRDGRVVVYLRVAEIRPRIAGAEVWKHRGSDFPRIGDQAVPGGAPENVEITPWK